ncbi:MAG: efflux RND transporter periplasmic adaptor subunit [bacterium]|nr:efflux RND transporter periplasmic adaptor subunit [bacterium]
MRKLLRALVNLLVVVVLAAGALFLFRNQTNQVVPEQDISILDETVVEPGDLSVTVSGTGAVLPARQVPLVFEASGLITEVVVAEGERVAAGQVIARLDTTDIENLLEEARLALDLQQIAFDALTAAPRDVDLAAAEAALNSAQASANAAYDSGSTETQAEIARLQAELARNRLWQAQLQRDIAVQQPTGFGVDVSALLPEDVEIPQDVIDQVNSSLSGLFPSQPGVSASQFDAGLNQAEFGVQIADANADAAASRPGDIAGIAQAQAAITSAQVALDRLVNGASERDLQIAQIGIEQAALAVEQAESSLQRLVLTAPFDGVLVRNTLTVGELPPTQDAAVILVDDETFFVDLAIDETDIVKVELGQAVEFRVDALPDEPITGRVSRIAVVPTIIGQLVTYPVRVTLDVTDAPIRIGMSATATIIVDELESILLVPNRFIRIDRNSQQAYVTVERDNGRFEEVPVELGIRSDTQSQIVNGLEAGQRVVLLPRAQFSLLNGPPN